MNKVTTIALTLSSKQRGLAAAGNALLGLRPNTYLDNDGTPTAKKTTRQLALIPNKE